ncbi:MAG: peroxiredoxin [Candidatus Dormibacteraeota bacterium]|nr:peroxiredoxin [Candidatus Dormibacteraeota bacterium]
MGAPTALPEFDLELGGGGRLRRADLLGRRTVLYFYPKDDTPGCTIEGREFTALLDDFGAVGVDVYGVSPDSPRSHARFAAKCELGIALISDPDKVLIGGLGLWVEKSMYGRTYNAVERSTFLVGDTGTIEREWHAVKAGGHAAEVLEAARPAG